MRVYHFLDEEYALENLEKQRIKISNIMELNDVFEFLFFDLSNTEFRKALKKTKKDFAKKHGILCFSKNWQNPVLWSHYANKHKGICLGFDIPDELLKEVDYTEHRLEIEDKITDEIMLRCLSTKYSHWSYEEEYRAFLDLEESENELYFSSFNENMCLKQVILGSRSRISRPWVLNALGERRRGVEIFKVRAAFKTFKMVRNNLDEVQKK